MQKQIDAIDLCKLTSIRINLPNYFKQTRPISANYEWFRNLTRNVRVLWKKYDVFTSVSQKCIWCAVDKRVDSFYINRFFNSYMIDLEDSKITWSGRLEKIKQTQ